MIIPCMNCTSAGEAGGNVARVVDGRVRVGFPGAPGWTTTGAVCALSGIENKHTRVASAHARRDKRRIAKVRITTRDFM